MDLKIEGSPEELQAFQQFIFEKDNNIQLDEEYQLSEGFNKEPLVIAVIIALTPVTIQLIKHYFDYRKKKLEADTARHIATTKKEEKVMTMSIKEGKSWKHISEGDLSAMEVNKFR